MRELQIETIVYNVSDLALFTRNSNEWNPSILIELLKLKLSPAETYITCLQNGKSLIVTTTLEKHHVVVSTLARHRT